MRITRIYDYQTFAEIFGGRDYDKTEEKEMTDKTHGTALMPPELVKYVVGGYPHVHIYRDGRCACGDVWPIGGVGTVAIKGVDGGVAVVATSVCRARYQHYTGELIICSMPTHSADRDHVGVWRGGDTNVTWRTGQEFGEKARETPVETIKTQSLKSGDNLVGLSVRFDSNSSYASYADKCDEDTHKALKLARQFEDQRDEARRQVTALKGDVRTLQQLLVLATRMWRYDQKPEITQKLEEMKRLVEQLSPSPVGVVRQKDSL